jgi:hypothetical protein
MVLKCTLPHMISWVKHVTNVAFTSIVRVFFSLLLPTVGTY